MNSLRRSIKVACAASVLSFGVALAQTGPVAPASPAAGETMAKPMMKKHETM